MTGALEIRYRPVASVSCYGRNARTHSAAQIGQIAASIQAFGWTNPLLIDEDGGLIAGHGRLAAAQRLAMAEVPTITLAGLSQAQRRALVLADNKLALNAGWDATLLAQEIGALAAIDFDLRLTGFDEAELTRLLPWAGGKTDPDDAPELPVTPVSRPGDVWQLGLHRLVCGDSTDKAAVVQALDGIKPLLMVTDPPYGVNYDPTWRAEAGVNRSKGKMGGVLNDDRVDWRAAWQHFCGNVAYVWHSGLYTGQVARSLSDCGFGMRAQIIWVKERFSLSRGHYHWQHEPAIYAVREGEEDGWRFEPDHEVAAYAVRDGKSADWQGGRRQSTVWSIPARDDAGHGHSTQKPVECMRRPIENNSSPGDAIYEPFCGSGTTLIAAQMMGRICRAIELNPAYVDVAVKRWQAFTGDCATLAASGETFDGVATKRAPASQSAVEAKAA